MGKKKRVLLSMLEKNEELQCLLEQELTNSGLNVEAHFWNGAESAVWATAARELSSCNAWVIAGNIFDNQEVRKTLSLCALSVFTDKGTTFPVMLSPSSKEQVEVALPTPLQNAVIVKNSLGAKCAILANTYQKTSPEYRLKPHDLGQHGLWFELGPVDAFWKGAIFASGVVGESKGFPLAHGVGIAGTIPESSTLQQPVEGLKHTIHDVPCTGFGVHNELNSSTSYYVKVSHCPDVLSFGPFPDGDATPLYTVVLV